VIGGGIDNQIEKGGTRAVIAGGEGNVIGANARSSIGGGTQNNIEDNAGESSIGGGAGNIIQTPASGSVISGGTFNVLHNTASSSAIGGGDENEVQTNSTFGTISGGQFNVIQPNADYATIGGGRENSATNFAFAAGRRAKANRTGAFVWADSTDADFVSTASNQFLIRAGGGVGIGKNNPATALDVSGTVTATGFSGSGSGLSGVNAGNITGGTLSDLRLSANVAFRSGGNAFTGNQTITSGSLGIGTATLDRPLVVQANGSSELMSLKETNGATRWHLNLQNGGLNFAQSGVADFRLFLGTNGNAGIGTATPVSALQVIGTVTATSFNPPSDRNLKENFTPVSAREVLDKVAVMPISRWNFHRRPGDAARRPDGAGFPRRLRLGHGRPTHRDGGRRRGGAGGHPRVKPES
jgi:hypothetical protein